MLRNPFLLSATLAILALVCPAGIGSCRAGDIVLDNWRPVDGGGWATRYQYMLVEGRYTLAPGERLVSTTVEWYWEDFNRRPWSRSYTALAGAIWPGNGRWAFGSDRYGFYGAPGYVTGFRVSLTYRTASGTLVTKSTRRY